jgi:DNA-binding IclR family transcriptional regulator
MTSNLKKEVATKARKVYSAPALEKGLDLLELLANEADGLNISEITNKLNKSVGELFRMLVVLEQRGYVEMSSGSDRYRLTLKMFGLSNRFPPIKRLSAIAGPVMQQLSYSIEQSCHLVIYYEGKGHVVVQKEPPSERVFSVRLGAEVPLINTCSGHILLAFSDKASYQTMLRKIPDHHLKADEKGLLSILSKVKDQGYESIISAQAQGVRDIGFPIFDANGLVIAALAIPFLEYLDGSHKVSFTEAQENIKEAAIKIYNKLGYVYE